MSSTPVVPTTNSSPEPTPDQQATATSPIDLSDIPNHVEHAWEDVKNLFETGDAASHPAASLRAGATMSAPTEPSAADTANEMTKELGEAAEKPWTIPSRIGSAISKETEPIENYTQEGRVAHPVLSRIGDTTRSVKELIGGGQSAGKPMGTKAGVGDEAMVLATAVDAAKAGATAQELAEKYGPKIAEHAMETARTFMESARDDFHSVINAHSPEGSAEAGGIKIGKKTTPETEEPSQADYHGDRINLAKTPNPKPTPKAPEAPTPRVDLSDIPGVKTVQHPVEITMHGPSWDRTHRMNVNGERAGSIGYHVDPDGTARIYGAHVPEHMRGQGIGQEGYKSIFKATEADPKIKRIQSDPTHISPDATHAWEAMQRKGEYPIENITHANGQPGFQIDFKKDEPGNSQVANSAQRYNQSIGKTPIDHGKTPLPSKEDRASLADAYDAAQHNPNDPQVQKAYQAMKTETKDQFNHAVNDMGIKVDFTKEDPYKNAQEMQADLKNNHHLSVFTGGEVPKDHPMAETDPETGQSYNNIFRATHDIFGHAAGGHDFSEAGEHSAYGAHSQMYTPDALPAVRTETQGQSNWFFNNKEVRNGKAPADFPEQKAAILPASAESGHAAATPKQMVESQGLVYKGELSPGSKVHMFEHPDHPGMTAAMNEKEGLTPESIKTKMDSKLSDFGVGPTAENTGYHPDLQKVADKYGVSDDASGVRGSGHQASFIAPDGKFIHLPAGTEHPTAIEGATGSRAAEDIPALGENVTRSNGPEDSRVRFIQDTGVVRTRFSKDRAGEALHVSVPEAGVSSEQMQSIKDAVRTSMPKGRGNIVMEVGVPGGKSETAEFATANNVEPMLNKIGAHPNDWTKKAESMMQESPAGAIDPRTGEADKTGFGVEVFPEARAKREPLDHAPTRDDIKEFHEKNKELFDKHPELRVGWDKTDKGYELNIGAAGPTQAGAELVGRKLGQRAAWDIEKGQEVPTGGTGEKTKFGQYKLEDRLNDLTGKNVAKLPPTIRNSEHLTDTEKHLLGSNETALRDFQATRKKIASVNELKATMQAGEPNRFWYDRAKKSFDSMFDSLPEGSYPPEDRNKFIGLVAATSPRSDVTENLASSLKAYRAWKDEGRPSDPATIRQVIDSSLMMPGSHGPNAMRALTNQPLSGPKVTSFQQNFMGSAKHVTNDMWGAITNGIVNPSDITSDGAYIALSENYRKAAASLGWTPQQGQAASWGFIRTLGNMSGLGGKLAGGSKPASEVMRMMDDPAIQKYSADIAEIFLTSAKVRERLEGLGVNLNEFDTKLNKSIAGYGRTTTGESGRPDPRLLAKSAQRVEDAKSFAQSESAKGKRVNEKAMPLLDSAQGSSAPPAKAGKSEGIPLSWLSKKAIAKD